LGPPPPAAGRRVEPDHKHTTFFNDLLSHLTCVILAIILLFAGVLGECVTHRGPRRSADRRVGSDHKHTTFFQILFQHVSFAVTLSFAGVPCELVTHWDPHRPLLVGGAGPDHNNTTICYKIIVLLSQRVLSWLLNCHLQASPVSW
jgi:hypothetical protein